MADQFLYPLSPAARDRWIVSKRPARNNVDPARPYAFHLEHERSSSGEIVPVATLFLTNRECPWRCVMCDLWRNTLAEAAPAGSIPAQISYALERLPSAAQIKLYNSGSFFDPRAIPPEEDIAIARLVAPFERVIVESHPSLINQRCLRFHDLLDAQLEVAMGLETAHPIALERLNKRISPSQFAHAADILRMHAIALRVFVLVQPPFIPRTESPSWIKQTIDFAFDCGATVVSLILTRAGNGAMEQLIETGDFSPPSLRALEDAVDYGIALRRGRVFADLWEIEQFASCSVCAQARINRLQSINHSQELAPRVSCNQCVGAS